MEDSVLFGRMTAAADKWERQRGLPKPLRLCKPEYALSGNTEIVVIFMVPSNGCLIPLLHRSHVFPWVCDENSRGHYELHRVRPAE